MNSIDRILIKVDGIEIGVIPSEINLDYEGGIMTIEADRFSKFVSVKESYSEIAQVIEETLKRHMLNKSE